MILSVLLCESGTAREENKLRMFENGVPKGVFALKSKEARGGLRILHDGPHHLYSSPSIKS
jgi:hypothetical protein